VEACPCGPAVQRFSPCSTASARLPRSPLLAAGDQADCALLGPREKPIPDDTEIRIPHHQPGLRLWPRHGRQTREGLIKEFRRLVRTIVKQDEAHGHFPGRGRRPAPAGSPWPGLIRQARAGADRRLSNGAASAGVADHFGAEMIDRQRGVAPLRIRAALHR
jgi:hypothetical protein